MTTKHTPGPWALTLRGEKYPYHTIQGDGKHVVVCEVDARGPAENHNPDADALLIAAAPELLEALAGIVAVYEAAEYWRERGSVVTIDFKEPAMVKYIKQARVAISKATGQQ